MTQEFNGDIQGQFAGRDIVNNNYAQDNETPWYEQPTDVLKQWVVREKQTRRKARQRKFINIPSIVLMLMFCCVAVFVYQIGVSVLVYKDFASLLILGTFVQEQTFYAIGFIVVLSTMLAWQASKTRLEHRIIRECNARIDDIQTVLKRRK